MTLRLAIFIALLQIALSASAIQRICLDGCLCVHDEANPVIGCEDGDRTELELPLSPLYGYEIIGFACNDLRSLPSYELLHAAFPDLKAIDIEGNPNFNCSQLPEFRDHITVNSDCGQSKPFPCLNKNGESGDCDWKCSALKKIKELWKKLKDSVSSKARDLHMEEMLHSAQNWFSRAFETVKQTVSGGGQ